MRSLSSALTRRVLPGVVALTVAAVATAALTSLSAAAATAPVPLGTAAQFSVLAASTVTNTGPSTLAQDVGLSPGTSITGFPPGVIGGTTHIADAVASVAQGDATTAFNNAAGRPADATVTELGGELLPPGVFSGPTLSLTGTLTLDAGGDPDAVFIFRSGSTLITAANSAISLINGASACNVFFVVGSSATLGTGSVFRGTLIALTSITAGTGTVVEGRLLARTGAVTLDTTTITRPVCSSAVVSPSPTAGPSATGTPPTAGTPTVGATSAPPTTGPTSAAPPTGATAAPTSAAPTQSTAPTQPPLLPTDEPQQPGPGIPVLGGGGAGLGGGGGTGGAGAGAGGAGSGSAGAGGSGAGDDGGATGGGSGVTGGATDGGSGVNQLPRTGPREDAMIGVGATSLFVGLILLGAGSVPRSIRQHARA